MLVDTNTIIEACLLALSDFVSRGSRQEFGEFRTHRRLLELRGRNSGSADDDGHGVPWVVELPRDRDDRLQPLCLVAGHLVAVVPLLFEKPISPGVPIGPGAFHHRCQMILDRACRVVRPFVEDETADGNPGIREPIAWR